jgi:hypothetical protein
MSEQAQTHAPGNGRAHAEDERYPRSESRARERGPARRGLPGPLEFDQSGFPIAQQSPSFGDRVARWLSS